METIAILLNELLERARQRMCLGANINASFDRRTVFSVENENEVDRELAEACEAIEKGSEFGVFTGLVMHAWYMEDRLCLVQPDADSDWISLPRE